MKRVVEGTSAVEKKHPCEDCRYCQWCSDDRCRLCMGQRCRGRRKLSIQEQIELYEAMNREKNEP